MSEVGRDSEARIKKEDLVSNSDDEQQTLFRLFGLEMTAPKGLKRPRIIYLSFIIINLIVLILLRNLITR